MVAGIKESSLKNLVVGLVVILVPLLFYTGLDGGDPVRFSKVLGLFYLALVASSYIVWRVYGATISVLFTLFVFNCISSGIGPAQQDVLLCVTGSLLLGYFFINRKLDFSLLFLDMMVISGITCCVLGYLQIIDKDPIFGYLDGIDRTLPTAFMGQHTVLGPWIVASATAALFRRRWVCFSFILPVVLYTKSSFTYLAMGAGVFCYLFYVLKPRAIVVISALSVLAFSAFVYLNRGSDFLNNSGRFEIWGATFNAWWNVFTIKQKIFGSGFGTYRILFPFRGVEENVSYCLNGLIGTCAKDHATLVSLQPWTTIQYGRFIHAHNEYLQMLFEAGLVGIGMIALTVYSLFKRFYKKSLVYSDWAMFSILLIFLIDAIGSFPFHLSPHGVITLCLLVFLLSPRNNELLH